MSFALSISSSNEALKTSSLHSTLNYLQKKRGIFTPHPTLLVSVLPSAPTHRYISSHILNDPTSATTTPK